MNNTYVYALDLSLNSTGVCIFTNDGRFVKAMTIDTTKCADTQLKLKLIGKEFLKLIKEYTPSAVAIEEGFTLYNRSTQQIFRVHGLANYIFCKYKQLYYPATTVKKEIGGRGNMNKEELREEILRKYPKIKFGSYDESDAFAVGKTYFKRKGQRDA